MNIKLDGATWVVNDGEFIIEGDIIDGYIVEDSDYEELYHNNNFENCLVWIYNSL